MAVFFRRPAPIRRRNSFVPAFASAGGNVAMSASVGTFVVTGIDAAFNVAMAEAARTSALNGNNAVLNVAMPSATASYVLTGVAAGLKVALTSNTGGYTLTGIAAALGPSLACGTAPHALTGVAASLNASITAGTGSSSLTGMAASAVVTFACGAGSFVLGGHDAYLSYDIDLHGIGGTIVPHLAGDELSPDLIRGSGTPFTRKRYRELVDAASAERDAARLAQELEDRRAIEMMRAATAHARAALRARWTQEDALAAASAYERAMQGALAAKAVAQRMRLAGHGAGHLQAALRASMAQREQDEEEEAIALLLLHS
jgi:hypothetical protein